MSLKLKRKVVGWDTLLIVRSVVRKKYGMEQDVKLKHCPKCNLDLPRNAFTSVQAKYCLNCLRFRKLEQRNEMMQRSISREKNKKQKTKVVQSVADLKKVAQKLVNKYVRLRDKDLTCISCGGDCGKDDAGHYIAQGSSGALRYNLDNIHKQGVGCNRFKHGNLILYRINLVKKIGADGVEWLENHRNDIKKWQREELLEIISKYQILLKSL